MWTIDVYRENSEIVIAVFLEDYSFQLNRDIHSFRGDLPLTGIKVYRCFIPNRKYGNYDRLQISLDVFQQASLDVF